MNGIIIYDDTKGRYVIEELIDGFLAEESKVVDLHCGDCLSVLVKKDKWVDTRVEKDIDNDVFGWYFVNVGRIAPLIGHEARI